MMNDRLTVQRDQRDGGWYVVVDGATKHFDTKPEAIRVATMELAAFEELSAMNADALENIESLQRTLEIERRKAVELRNRLNDQSHELAEAKGEISATRGLLEDVQKMRDEQAKKLKEAEEMEAFHRHFINELLTENFKMMQAMANWFVKEYGSELLV